MEDFESEAPREAKPEFLTWRNYNSLSFFKTLSPWEIINPLVKQKGVYQNSVLNKKIQTQKKHFSTCMKV